MLQPGDGEHQVQGKQMMKQPGPGNGGGKVSAKGQSLGQESKEVAS